MFLRELEGSVYPATLEENYRVVCIINYLLVMKCMKLISISWGRARSQAHLLRQNGSYGILHYGLDTLTDIISIAIFLELMEKK